jgi:hypothetical protein
MAQDEQPGTSIGKTLLGVFLSGAITLGIGAGVTAGLKAGNDHVDRPGYAQAAKKAVTPAELERQVLGAQATNRRALLPESRYALEKFDYLATGMCAWVHGPEHVIEVCKPKSWDRTPATFRYFTLGIVPAEVVKADQQAAEADHSQGQDSALDDGAGDSADSALDDTDGADTGEADDSVGDDYETDFDYNYE